MVLESDQDKSLEGSKQSEPRRRRQMTFADQELRLISALVLMLAIGLFLALPFVLSIGSVVFLPLVTAMMRAPEVAEARGAAGRAGAAGVVGWGDSASLII